MLKWAIAIALLFSCTSPDRARSALFNEGFTNVELTGYAWTKCADQDSTCTGFIATSPAGHTVRGAVGCGYDIGGCGKGCTVRLE